MIALSHPTGNEFVRALLSALEDSGMLEVFQTTLATKTGRRHYDLPGNKIRTRPMRETARLISQRLGLEWLTRHETGWASLDAVYRDLDSAFARFLCKESKADGAYCYEDGALETFCVAKRAGKHAIYELPIAYWETSRRLLCEEADRLPDWEPSLIGTRNSAEKLERKSRELALADLIICPSRFVLDSVPDEARNKCVVAEFGSPSLPEPVRRENAGCLRILFAGSMTQRKGLADLFAAMKLLKRTDVELVVMGTPILPIGFYRERYAGFIYEAPRSHNAVLDLMASCDALVLPSIVEGRALVQQEAMSCGLPLIVTANAGGEDLIEEEVTGFLVPIRSPEKIAEKIAWLADHRSRLPMMREAARRKSQTYTWEAYAGKILAAIRNLEANQP